MIQQIFPATAHKYNSSTAKKINVRQLHPTHMFSIHASIMHKNRAFAYLSATDIIAIY